MMSVLVPIGDFSRMTHLSVKALRFYHDQGLLEPARIDPSSGYRFYDTGQVPVAQVIRRFRDLDMPLDQVRAVLKAPDVETRTKEIIAHLSATETKLAELQMSVSSLRALLEGPVVRPEVEFRSIPATRALAVRGTVTVQEATHGVPATMRSQRSSTGSMRSLWKTRCGWSCMQSRHCTTASCSSSTTSARFPVTGSMRWMPS